MCVDRMKRDVRAVASCGLTLEAHPKSSKSAGVDVRIAMQRRVQSKEARNLLLKCTLSETWKDPTVAWKVFRTRKSGATTPVMTAED